MNLATIQMGALGTQDKRYMSKLVGGVAGIVALAAGIFSHVDAILCLQRAAVALVIGGIVGAFIQALLGSPVPVAEPKAETETPKAENSEEAAKEAA